MTDPAAYAGRVGELTGGATRAGSVLVQKTLFCTGLARTETVLVNAPLAESTEYTRHHYALFLSLIEARARYALVPYHKLECLTQLF